eukprot:gene11976-7760_t
MRAARRALLCAALRGACCVAAGLTDHPIAGDTVAYLSGPGMDAARFLRPP